MHEISTTARAIIDHLHLGNKWNLPGKHGHHAAATVNKCDNCGSLDHLAPKCPKPCDGEKCKKACKAQAKAKETEGGHGQGRGGRGGGAGCGDVIIPRMAPTLESQTLTVLGKCIVPNVVGGIKHTLPSIMKSSNSLQLRSRCHHTILSG